MTANTGRLTLFLSKSAVSTTVPITTTDSVSVGAKSTVTVSARKISAKEVENAVYAHIQAVRALGKTKIAPEEIARALDLPVSAVEHSLSALQSKGVKVIRHG
jgi:hypothetical protein